MLFNKEFRMSYTCNIISIISILIVVLFCCLSQKLKGTVCKISSLDISQLQSTELCFIPLLIQLHNPSYLATVGQPTLAVIYGSKFRLSVRSSPQLSICFHIYYYEGGCKTLWKESNTRSQWSSLLSDHIDNEMSCWGYPGLFTW